MSITVPVLSVPASRSIEIVTLNVTRDLYTDACFSRQHQQKEVGLHIIRRTTRVQIVKVINAHVAHILHNARAHAF